jgi:dTDP-4-dehydrorhamnose reductase
MQTILVTGANGQVGNEFRTLAPGYPAYNFLFVGKDELAIDDLDAVAAYFNVNKIDCCINCAAYTAVDKAENEKEKAFAINADAAGNLAAVCKNNNARLIHISTDYVFDGKTDKPYIETDKVNTINVYGASKLKGEELVMQHDPSAIIIRTSWVYSSFGNNFVKTMLRLMKDRESINVVNDQQGRPTYAADLAKAILQIIESGKTAAGIYHYSNKGVISWFQFAAAIAEITNSKCVVHPIPSSEYPTPAQRPEFSVLDTTKIEQTFAVDIPGWKDSLEKCLLLLS